MSFDTVIIGCGQIAGGYDEASAKDSILTHAKAFKNNSAANLVGVFDTNADVATKFAKFWGAEKAFNSLEELMEQCRPDIVSICTPNKTHFEIFEFVSSFSPRAVICEKPIALSSVQGEKMLETAKKKNILLAVNYMRRWDTELTKLGQKIVSGEFGKLQNGKVLYTKGVFHNASHGINLLESWIGKSKEAKVLKVHKQDSEDFLADFTLETSQGHIVFQTLDASLYNYFEIELNFSKARMVLPGGGAEIQIQMASGGTLTPVQVTKGTLNKALAQVINNVIDCLNDKSSLKMSAESAIQTVKTCEMVREKI